MRSIAEARGINSRLCGSGVILLLLGAAGFGGIKLAESRDRPRRPSNRRKCRGES